MNKDFIKTKSWFETLSEIIKDEFIGLNLTKDIGDYLIRENTDLHNEVNSLIEIATEIKEDKKLKIQILKELNYHSVINCKNLNDFFQINHSFIINANNFLEKLSCSLKKIISNDYLSEEDKKFAFYEDDKKINTINYSKIIQEKDEEINNYKTLLVEKDQMIKNMKEEISSFKIKLDNMKLNFSFDSIENINRNIHFFDEKLLRQKSEKQKNKQMSLLNAFQQNLNVKGANSQKFDFGGLFGSANNENINSLETRNNENEDIGDPIFFKTWDILLQRFDDECKKIFQNENGEDIYEKK